MMTPTSNAAFRREVWRYLGVLISLLLLAAPAFGAETRENVGTADSQKLSDPRQHWAFQAVKKPSLPNVKNTTWIRSPADAFILAKLEERGWKPAPLASRSE